MRRIKPINTGFTLVEVLVVAPITMLVLATFVLVMANLVGEVLVQRERNIMTYNLQDAGDKIENDIKLATAFPATSGTMNFPQGVNDSTTPFASSSALILTELGVTKRPPANDRDLSFAQNPAVNCGTPLQYRNSIVMITVVYFLDSNATVWRRTIVPSSPAACPGLTPWQQNSCSPAKVPSNLCKVSDIKIASDITSMSLSYYDTAGGTAATTASPTTTLATVKLTSTKKVAGRTFTVTNAVSATKLNF